ncbi:MAG: VOC family protein [Bryobacteraceae bacterium]|nr:VOC family protein [Bryobacteraceae bacterium]
MPLFGGALGGRVDHIGLVVGDLEPAMDGYHAAYRAKFGVFEVDERTSVFSGSSAAYRIRIAVAQVGGVSIELIQPMEGETLYSRFLASRGPGLHHLGTYVTSLARSDKELQRRGYVRLLEGRIRGLGKFGYFEAPELACIVEPLELSLAFPLFLAKRAKWYPQA